MTDTNADRTDKSTDTEPDADLSANRFGLNDADLLDEFDAEAEFLDRFDVDAVDQLDDDVAELWDTPSGEWWP